MEGITLMPIPERVILVKGDPHKWYDQAIFIINPAAKRDSLPVDFVAEAERIINGYMDKSRRAAPQAVTGFAPGTGTSTVSALALPAQSTAATAAKPTKKSASKSRADFWLTLLMMMGCVAIAILFFYGFVLS